MQRDEEVDPPAGVVIDQHTCWERAACDEEDNGDAEVADYDLFGRLMRGGDLDLGGDEDDKADGWDDWVILVGKYSSFAIEGSGRVRRSAVACVPACPVQSAVILLLRYAPTLSARLGSQACLSNGEFMLPGTASIWDPEG